MHSLTPQDIAERTARTSYGRLLAALCARTHDISAAEDALADAFAAALRTWPQDGAPTSPEAWLLTAARRKLIDAARRDETRRKAQPDLALALDELHMSVQDRANVRFPDERLKLLYICAHPAIDASIRTPLMLQTVLGLDATKIAAAFLTSPATMGQRLVRAKRKIRQAAISFETPDQSTDSERSAAVLDAIYAAFNAVYTDKTDGNASLKGEALYLAGLMREFAPRLAEASGLYALMLYIQSREAARSEGGQYTPLEDQNTDLWNMSQFQAAENALKGAAHALSPGRYQLEAAIQSAHMVGKLNSEDTSPIVISLYDKLLRLSPSLGAEVGKAAALLKISRQSEALAVLDALPADRVRTYQPYWATRAHVLAAMKHPSTNDAFDTAIALCADPAARRFLTRVQAKHALDRSETRRTKSVKPRAHTNHDH